MSSDHLNQHHLAEMSTASAEHSQGSLGPSDNLHKTTGAQLSAAEVESSTFNPPTTLQLTSQPSIAPIANGNPTSASTDPQPATVRDPSERNLAHEAALRRLHGLDSQSKRGRKASEAPSIASTQPVLVREYSQASPSSAGSKQSRMRQKRNSSANRDSSEMPPLESFSFQDILASIDPEIHGSIDKIAEMCGRSKMSLADEYSSHLPPQGDFSLLGLEDHGDQTGISRLEPVEEASSTHEEAAHDPRSTRSRAARLSLVATSTRAHEDLLSAPVTATSAVAPDTQSRAVREDPRRPAVQSSYIPQLLAWLRSSRDNAPRSSQTSRRNSRATNALQAILGNADTTTS